VAAPERVSAETIKQRCEHMDGLFTCENCGKKSKSVAVVETAHREKIYCSEKCYKELKQKEKREMSRLKIKQYQSSDEYKTHVSRLRVVKEYHMLLANSDRLTRRGFVKLMALAEYLGRDLEEWIGENGRLKKMHTSLVAERELLEEADARKKMKPKDIAGDPNWRANSMISYEGKQKCEICGKLTINCKRYTIHDDQDNVIGETGWRCIDSKCKYNPRGLEEIIRHTSIENLQFTRMREPACEICNEKDGTLHKYKVCDENGKLLFITGWRHDLPNCKSDLKKVQHLLIKPDSSGSGVDGTQFQK